MSSFQNPNFKKLTGLLIPTSLRSSKVLAFLKVLVNPINTLHDTFKVKRENNIYKLEHNSQVCYLRKALNDSFDNEVRRIEIIDGNRFAKTYIYTDAEKKDKYLNTLYLHDESVFDDTGVDFIVLIPFGIWDNEKTEINIAEYRFYNIEAVVNFYRLASKRYKIDFK